MDISAKWKMYELPLSVDSPEAVYQSKRVLSTDLPCDVRMPLMANGVIGDPRTGLHAQEQRWIEDRSWWFVRELDPSEYDLSAEICELRIETIDSYGEIFLNGERIGTHKNVNVPFVCDIKECLKPSGNVLMIRVTTGLELVSKEEMEVFNLSFEPEEDKPFDGSFMPQREDKRRAFIRRPQYSTGWDWIPRMTTCGITGKVSINCYSGAIVRDFYIHTVEVSEASATLCCKAEIELCDMFGSSDGDVSFALSFEGQKVAEYEQKDIFLKSGYNTVSFDVEVADPKLWWPNGMGEQPIYQAQLSVTANSVVNQSNQISVGICTVKLNIDRIDEKRRNFAFEVNGVKLFCKGANWVPADAIYAQVDEEKYRRLVEEAKKANLTMLRLWGGGIYEPDCFFEECLKNGILLWQDFMFSCAHYPDHNPEFLFECQKELEYQTKRLRKFANLALLCGNNEICLHQSPLSQFDYSFSMNHKNTCGYYIFNHLAPITVEKYCPHITYWNSSPYGGNLSNSTEIGDQHHWWLVSLPGVKNSMVEPVSYDYITSNFVSEYGCMAPVSKASMMDYAEDEPIDRDSLLLKYHTNSFENGMIAMGIEQNYCDPTNLTLDEYILYGQMMQNVMYQYSLEAMRFIDLCNGALFWMYHDVWGEDGWTIVDYYMRRKASYYGVKRAFATVRAIFRQQEDTVVLKIANDTDEEQTVNAKVGFISYDGTQVELKQHQFRIAPYSCESVLQLSAELSENGTWFFIPDDQTLETAYWYRTSFKNLPLVQPELKIEQKADGNDTVVTVKSNIFAHGVHFTDDYYASDNYFDLVPGVSKTFRIYDTKGASVEIESVILPSC